MSDLLALLSAHRRHTTVNQNSCLGSVGYGCIKWRSCVGRLQEHKCALATCTRRPEQCRRYVQTVMPTVSVITILVQIRHTLQLQRLLERVGGHSSVCARMWVVNYTTRAPQMCVELCQIMDPPLTADVQVRYTCTGKTKRARTKTTRIHL